MNKSSQMERTVMSKRKRSRFVGAYAESPFPPIDLPFTITNFLALLTEGARPDSHYTHQQIAEWADQFWWTQFERPDFLGIDVPPEIEKATDIAQDVEMQWVMYLADTYTLAELQHLDRSKVRLPHEWYSDWLTQLLQLVPPTAAE
jgi:hypothetical protein